MKRCKLLTKGTSILLIVLCLLGPHVYAICDFNDDGDCDTVDIDTMYRESDFFSGAPTDPKFDLDGDGVVDGRDVDAWLDEAGPRNGFASPFLHGDADLDGAVNATDLNALGLSWQKSDRVWSQGNFSADGRVDAADLMLLGLNWQQSIPLASASVPEPTGLMLVCVAAIFGVWLVVSRSR